MTGTAVKATWGHNKGLFILKEQRPMGKLDTVCVTLVGTNSFFFTAAIGLHDDSTSLSWTIMKFNHCFHREGYDTGTDFTLHGRSQFRIWHRGSFYSFGWPWNVCFASGILLLTGLNSIYPTELFSVVVGDASSSVACLTCGVPQGSILGPLFCVYTLLLGHTILGSQK